MECWGYDMPLVEGSWGCPFFKRRWVLRLLLLRLSVVLLCPSFPWPSLPLRLL